MSSRASNHTPQPRISQERRATQRLIQYWEHIKGERIMPEEAEIDADHGDINDLWDHCFLVQVRDLEHAVFNYSYLGDAIIRAYGGALTLSDPGSLVSPAANKLVHIYERLMDVPLPILDEGSFTNGAGSLVMYRQCFVPLGKGRNVESILGVMGFLTRRTPEK